MLLAADKLTLTITKECIEEAINTCLSLIPNYSIFTMSNGKSEISQAGGTVITELLGAKNHCLSRKELLRKYWQTIDSDLLEKLIVTLESAGMVQQVQTKEGLFVQLTQQCLNMLQGEKR